jgi:hypothetical protein
VFVAVEEVLRFLQKLKGVFRNAWIREGKRLRVVVVRYLITCYCSADLNFSMGSMLAGHGRRKSMH